MYNPKRCWTVHVATTYTGSLRALTYGKFSASCIDSEAPLNITLCRCCPGPETTGTLLFHSSCIQVNIHCIFRLFTHNNHAKKYFTKSSHYQQHLEHQENSFLGWKCLILLDAPWYCLKVLEIVSRCSSHSQVTQCTSMYEMHWVTWCHLTLLESTWKLSSSVKWHQAASSIFNQKMSFPDD